MTGLTRMGRSRRLAIGALVLALSVIAGGVATGAVSPAIKTITPHSAGADHQHRRAAPADPQLLRRPARAAASFAADSNYAKEASPSRRAGAALAGRSPHHGSTARRRSCWTSTTPRWRPGTTRSSATGPSTRRPTPRSSPASSSRPCPAWSTWSTRPRREGYAIFFLTGRPATQEAATLGNLTADGIGVDAGYPEPTTLNDGEDGLFTKPAVADYPHYLRRPAPATRTARARRSTTSPRPARTSSRSATTSSPTSATSSAT